MSGNNGKQAEPAIINTIHIDTMSDGQVRVRNFSQNPVAAMSTLQAAQTILFGYFLQQAVRGELPGQSIIRPNLGVDRGALKVKP
jgi:hypothetical protein